MSWEKHKDKIVLRRILYEKLYRISDNIFLVKHFRDLRCLCSVSESKNITSDMVRLYFLPAQGWVDEIRAVSAIARRLSSTKRRKTGFLSAVYCQNFSNIQLCLAHQNQQHCYCSQGISLALYVHKTFER